MKMFSLVAAFGAALLTPVAAMAADAPQSNTGHYEWRSVQQAGPRAAAPAQQRVWVSDRQVAAVDCDMMKMNATDCMKPMQNMGEKSHG